MLAKPTSLTLILAALLGFACTVAATYPGIVSYDSVAQWEQAISADYSDWHPPIMAWLWSWLSPQTLGPRALFVLQMALYWGAFLSVACALRERAGWVLACALLPFTLNFSFVIWKDVWMAIMFALSAASAIHALTATRGGIGLDRRAAVSCQRAVCRATAGMAGIARRLAQAPRIGAAGGGTVERPGAVNRAKFHPRADPTKAHLSFAVHHGRRFILDVC